MMQKLQLEETAFGKFLIVVDTVGLTLSVGFYGLNLGAKINECFPPIILILTSVSLLTSIIYKAAFEYRQLKERKAKKKKE